MPRRREVIAAIQGLRQQGRILSIGNTRADGLPGQVTLLPSGQVADGYFTCNGQAIERDVYAELFDEIGTTFGNGDGLNTFNVPDLSGASTPAGFRYVIRA